MVYISLFDPRLHCIMFAVFAYKRLAFFSVWPYSEMRDKCIFICAQTLPDGKPLAIIRNNAVRLLLYLSNCFCSHVFFVLLVIVRYSPRGASLPCPVTIGGG